MSGTEKRDDMPHIPVNWDGTHEDEVLHDGDFESEWKVDSAG